MYKNEIKLNGYDLTSLNYHNNYNTNLEVFYDKKQNKFCTKRENGEWAHADFFSDARTTISTAPLSQNYIDKNIVKVDDVEKYATYNGVGWCISKNIIKNDDYSIYVL